MTRIVVDDTLRSKLHNLSERLELIDNSGRVLGRFVPVVDMSEWEPVSPDVSEEELDRREEETESFTTAEMLAYLENLKCSESDGNDPLSTN